MRGGRLPAGNLFFDAPGLLERVALLHEEGAREAGVVVVRRYDPSLPPILGDPTPGPAPDGNRPLSRDEMDRAPGRLKYLVQGLEEHAVRAWPLPDDSARITTTAAGTITAAQALISSPAALAAKLAGFIGLAGPLSSGLVIFRSGVQLYSAINGLINVVQGVAKLPQALIRWRGV